MPDEVRRNGDILEFHLGPEICDRLAGIATVRLRVREPDIGVVGTTVVPGDADVRAAALRTATTTPSGSAAGRRRRPARAGPPAAPGGRPPNRPRRRRHARIAAGTRSPGRSAETLRRDGLDDRRRAGPAGGGCANTIGPITSIRRSPSSRSAHPAPTPLQPPAAQPPAKSVRETVAEYLATKPTPEAMLAKAQTSPRRATSRPPSWWSARPPEQGTRPPRSNWRRSTTRRFPPRAAFRTTVPRPRTGTSVRP